MTGQAQILVLMGFALAGEVLQSANEMQSTRQASELQGEVGRLLPDTIIHSRLP